MVMKSLSQSYNRENVLYDLSNFLTESFNSEDKHLNLRDAQYENIDEAHYLGKNNLFSVFEIFHNRPTDARITLTKMAVHIMKDRGLNCALFFFVPKDKETFRISLVTVDWANNRQASNPRRFSFLVGKGQKLHTAIKQLSTPAADKADLIKKFSIEVVNDAFYKAISEQHFYPLLKQIRYPANYEMTPQNEFEIKQNFSVRLIGRLIFCWFLKKKYRSDNTPLIPEELLSTQAVKDCPDTDNYYHKVLEPLFFETLNKEFKDRIPKCKKGLYEKIPFLNGGLFESQKEDCYKYDTTTETCLLGNAVTIENKWFIDFFTTLETYNFTIDENTSTDIDLAVDPEMLGRIFENLLAAINPETQDSVRKATGSYYTPRDIVDYMVNKSLKQYLYTKTNIDHELIDCLFEFAPNINYIKERDNLTNIYKALSSIKIIDPAVGSGAFPMGILQKIMSIIHLIDPLGEITKSSQEKLLTNNFSVKQLDYFNKHKLIRDCIYGVDIQPMAIEICRLRFFLTLIVEEESDNPNPLPNLTFNFTCANTLVPLPKQDEDELFSGRTNLISELKQVRKHFFNSYGQEKEELKHKFKTIQDKIWKQTFYAEKQLLINDNIYNLNRKPNSKEYADELAKWEPFSNDSNKWFDPFWMFGIEDGFDIVIGNPPYVVYGLNQELSNIYKNYSDAYNMPPSLKNKRTRKQFNLFAVMLEKGTKFLNTKGNLAFIIPHSFVRSNGYNYIRNYLFKTNKIIYHIVDEGKAFENVTLEMVSIFITDKQYASQVSSLSKRDLKLRQIPLELLEDKIYLYYDGITAKLLSYPQNIVSGFRGIDAKSKDSGTLFYLGGKSTKKYFLDNNYISKISNSGIDKYFSKSKKLDNEEIVITQFGVLYPRGTIINTKKYCPSGGNVIVKHIKGFDKKFILAILNSKLINFFFSKDILNHAELTIHLDGQYLEEIPIPNTKQKDQTKFIDIVNKILLLTQSEKYLDNKDKQKKVKQYQEEIDKMVYKLYDLTTEEIKIVEASQSNKD